jgi:ribosomal protein S18 acetylase RimI-like enzyme
MDTIVALGIGAATLRPFESARDTEAVGRIVGQIWHGGSSALMEKRFGRIGGQHWEQWQSKSVLDYLKAEGCHAFVIQEGDEVIGFCSYTLDAQRQLGTVGYNGVASEHQGRKLGSAMMDFVMKQIREAGMLYAAVIVADNPEHAPARRIYEKHGFEPLVGMQYMVQKLQP